MPYAIEKEENHRRDAMKKLFRTILEFIAGSIGISINYDKKK